MAKEIERKFLLANDTWRAAVIRAVRMSQGYLANNERASVRVRVAGDEASLNIKGAGLVAVRDEFEYPLPLDDARYLLDTLSAQPLVDKTRHWVAFGGLQWEIDVFHGDNDGLVVAEIELDHPDQAFDRPPWLGSEVTSLHRYYNVNLVAKPFAAWTDEERKP